MKQSQENIVGMFETALQHLDNNNSIWKGIPAFGTALGEAKNTVGAIRTLQQNQEKSLSGIVDEKQEARTDLQERLLVIAGCLADLAEKTNDGEMAADVDLDVSHVDVSDDRLVQIGKRVLAHANNHTNELTNDYAQPATAFPGLDAAIQLFDKVRTAPRTAISSRGGQTGTIPQLIADARRIFRKRIDRLMRQFRLSLPEFFLGYQAARVVVNRPATHAKAGNGSAAPTPAPVPAHP